MSQNMVPDTYQCLSIIILSSILNTYLQIFQKSIDILTKKVITWKDNNTNVN